MELYIGGFAQGKLAYVRKKYPQYTDLDVMDGSMPCGFHQHFKIWNHFHLWVKRRLLEGGDPESELEQFLTAYPDSIIICDEIGNGIIPLDHEERQYREYTGRLLCRIAKEAVCGERIICGVGCRIK